MDILTKLAAEWKAQQEAPGKYRRVKRYQVCWGTWKDGTKVSRKLYRHERAAKLVRRMIRMGLDAWMSPLMVNERKV